MGAVIAGKREKDRAVSDGTLSVRQVVEKCSKRMGKEMKTVRLIYPQWQGADIVRLVPEVKDPADAARGYYLGARLLDFLAPAAEGETLTVPVDTAMTARTVQDGVIDRDIIFRQTQAALAMVWIDAHPDLTWPGDVYQGYHAMAVAACMGDGEQRIASLLPARFSPSQILYVGLRNWERDEIKVRQRMYGIAQVSKEELTDNSDAVRRWLDLCVCSKVVVHLDLDVLDPAEIVAAVGTDPGGMSMEQVVRVVDAVAKEKELVGLTVAEPMPRTAIRLRNLLHSLPLLR